MNTFKIKFSEDWHSNFDMLKLVGKCVSQPERTEDGWKYTIVIPTCGQQYEKQNNIDEVVEMKTPKVDTYLPNKYNQNEDLS